MNCADLDNLLIEDDGVVLVGQQLVQHLSLLGLKEQDVELVVLPPVTLQQRQQQVQTLQNLKEEQIACKPTPNPKLGFQAAKSPKPGRDHGFQEHTRKCIPRIHLGKCYLEDSSIYRCIGDKMICITY